MLVAATLLLLLFGGCSVLIAGVVSNVEPSEIKEGPTRAAAQAKLGEPIRSERTREGARIDTYEYKKGLGQRDLAQDIGQVLAYDIVTLGVAELFFTPGALYFWYTAPRERARIYYDPTDHVLWVSAPEPSP